MSNVRAVRADLHHPTGRPPKRRSPNCTSRSQTVVERFGGNIENTENWGRRRLAYEIAGHREGVYVLELINGPAELIAELDRRLRVFDIVIRHMVVRVDEEARDRPNARATRRKTDMADAPRQTRPAAGADRLGAPSSRRRG